MISVRLRLLLLCTSFTLIFLVTTTCYLHFSTSSFPTSIASGFKDFLTTPPKSESPPETSPPPRKYKPVPLAKSHPIVDNFPLAALAQSPKDLPPVPSWNRPPNPHVPEQTPLFIGFTRNWRLLQQAVVSYITAGWPPSDIYVVENTGVMHSNKNGLLTLQNPFFLNHTRLSLLGVNILITPTLLTFAQLQNFFLSHSVNNNWTHYFWSHMDVVVLSFEDQYAMAHIDDILPNEGRYNHYEDFKSLYLNCVDELHSTIAVNQETGKTDEDWAMRFFSYNRLALVNVDAYLRLGGWDTLIPYYMTDCDMHARIEMMGMGIKEVIPGIIFDVASSLEDLVVLYRGKGEGVPEVGWRDPNLVEEELRLLAEAKAGLERVRMDEEKEGKVKSEKRQMGWGEIVEKWKEDEIYSERWREMIGFLDDMTHSKDSNERGRNTWQATQVGGVGEPFYRDSDGFELGIQMTIEHGKKVYAEKWGHRDCDIVAMGLKLEDAWKVEKDWE